MNIEFKGVWIPKEIWLNKDLTWLEKLYFIEIDSLDNEKGCYASNGYFADFFNLSKARCSQIIKALIEKEYLRAEYIKKEAKNTLRVLRIFIRGIKYSKQGIKKTEPNNIYNNIVNNKYKIDFPTENKLFIFPEYLSCDQCGDTQRTIDIDDLKDMAINDYDELTTYIKHSGCGGVFTVISKLYNVLLEADSQGFTWSLTDDRKAIVLDSSKREAVNE